jgi:hypothetical protein
VQDHQCGSYVKDEVMYVDMEPRILTVCHVCDDGQVSAVGC